MVSVSDSIPTKVLMLAPEPVFSPRGTPFSVVGRLKAYSDLGIQVDLVTYHLGQDVALPGVRFHRIPATPGIRRVKVGPSLIKPWLDALLFVRALKLARSGSYDLVHSHEEAGLIGALFRRMFGWAHLYDMHSSLSQQMKNFRFSSSRVVIGLMEWVERTILANSDAVLVICEDLRRYASDLGHGHKLWLLENTIDYSFLWQGTDWESEGDLSDLPRPWVTYVGTLEPYQGIDLFLESVRLLVDIRRWEGTAIIAGGNERQVSGYRQKASSMGLNGTVHFLGTVSPARAEQLVRTADILVSPRVSGTNTPLKIYSYLRSGKPIVATRIRSHTQVLDEQVCLLCEPEAKAFANALGQLLADASLRGRLGENARRYAMQRYSDVRYRQTLLDAVRQALTRKIN